MTKTIMIVDDEHDTVDGVITLLKSTGYNTMFAYNGKECLKKIKKTQPDIILLDVMMPGMTANDVIKEINKDAKLKKIKIIYLTAVTASQDEKDSMIKLGNVSDFIEKPFDMKNLLNRIEKALK